MICVWEIFLQTPCAGLPGGSPQDLELQRFWYTVVTLGQLHNRLVRPYQQLPLMMASIVDNSMTVDDRLDIATKISQLKPCCTEKLFATPVIACMRQAGGPNALVSGPLSIDLQSSMRGKTSNVEIELNFARAACTRASLHGRAHSIGSMVSKHVSAELKLAQKRCLMKDPSTAPTSSTTTKTQGKITYVSNLCDNLCIVFLLQPTVIMLGSVLGIIRKVQFRR